MFRFASLYAIGQLLNRTPIYDNNESKMLIIDNELKETFPNFHSRIYYLKKDFNDTFKQNFSKTCCEYVDPNINDSSYKICVHTRVGDFKGNGETKIEEVDKAMEILTTFLKSYLVCI
uniref:DRBM domain-containing protein n=1 Tax=Meloidogyne hapla TaxID=6305 RepID=A0A1I8BWJ6_MELHA